MFRIRTILSILFIIGLIIFILILAFSGGGNSSKPQPPLNLLQYQNSAEKLVLTINGPVNAEQNHSILKMEITDTANTITDIDGYQNTVDKTQTNPNNDSAYNVLLHALKYAGLTNTKPEPSTSTDPTGQCALGTIYTIQLVNPDGTDALNSWHSTCGYGTFSGNLDRVLTLFQNQFPNYGDFAADENLG